MNSLEHLGNFMLSQIVVDHGRTSLEPDEDLLEQGMIDSLGVMKLIVFMEDTFKIRINDEEIIPENFHCLNGMVRLVEEKIQQQ
jgi:acyl carrier protein